MNWVNELHVGECVELLGRMTPDSADLVVTSPPYDDLRQYAGDCVLFDSGKVVNGLWRVMKPGGVVVWVTGDKTIKGSESLSSFRHAQTFCEVGFRLHDTMIYQKQNPIPMNHNRYEQSFEYMFVFSKGRPKTFNPIRVPITSPRPIQQDVHHVKNYQRGNTKRGHRVDKIKGNIWSYNIGKGCSTKDAEAFAHPAIFPEQLAIDHILSWSQPGDLVLDPMCGSGTVPKASAQLGRNYLGFDLSPEYIAIARQRLARVQEPNTGLFTP